jgi:cation transport ATPase
MQHRREGRQVDSYTRDNESEAEKLDRNWNELLQELRVSQTGVQVLTGFLLTLPLQPTFARLGTFERNAYVAAISLAIAATCLLIAPVSMHRVLFRERRKGSLVRVGSLVAKAGLSVLALATTAVVIFIFSVIFSRETGLWVGAAVLLMFTVAWLGVPLLMRRAEREGSS